MTATERANIYVEAAIMARDNARQRRAMARQWPDHHPEWVANDLREARRAFQRAYGYLHTARQMRAYR